MSFCKEVPLCCYDLQPKMKKVGNYLYLYENLIAKGRFGQVFSAMNTLKSEPVAIKVVNTATITQEPLKKLLYQQVQLLSSLQHPNIVKCHSILKSRNNHYIIMELCEKENLEQVLRRKKKFSEKEIERYIYDIFLGLQYLGQNNIVHRDLKTSNILLSHNGKAKISDFGFATKCICQINDIFLGTPQYMTPEALMSQVYGPKTDIWAFGVIIYELLHGFTPMSLCQSKEDILEKACEVPRITETISQDLMSLMESCLEPNYHHRISFYELCKHPYIGKLKQKFFINTEKFKPFTVGNKINRQKTKTEVHESDIISTKAKNFPSHFESLDLPEFQTVRFDYGQTAAMLNYCRLIDKTITASYNQHLCRWLISLIGILKCETFINRKKMTKNQYEKLRKTVQRYYDKYHWKYPYLKPIALQLITKDIIYLLNKLISKEEKLGAKTLLKSLESETMKLKKSLVHSSLRSFEAETDCQHILKNIQETQ